MAKVMWNFTLQSTPWENAKKGEIAVLQTHQIKMQLKYSVTVCWNYILDLTSTQLSLHKA